MKMDFSEYIFNPRGDVQNIRVIVDTPYPATDAMTKNIAITVFDGYDNQPKGKAEIIISKEQSLRLLLMLQKIHY
jgi:hypothetical protein